MNQLIIPWEQDNLPLPVAPDVSVTTLAPVYPNPLTEDQITTLIEPALHLLATRIDGKTKVAVIIEDPSRPSKTGDIVRLLLKWFNRYCSSLKELMLIIAAGAHYQLEQTAIFNKIGGSDRPVLVHDATDNSNLTLVGWSNSGIPLICNTRVVEADLRLSISTVNIHPLAGFSGGGKIILPGVAGLETITALHALPSGKPGEHTPMTDLITEMLEKVPIDLSFQLVSRPDGEVVRLFSGPVRTAHRQAMEAIRGMVAVPKPIALYPMVIAGCRPFNQNLIGTFKSLAQIPKVLAPGGGLILFNEAIQGIGDHYWRNRPDITQREKEKVKKVFEPYHVNIYSPHTNRDDFMQIFPETFNLLKNTSELAYYFSKYEKISLAFLPYAPITLLHGVITH